MEFKTMAELLALTDGLHERQSSELIVYITTLEKEVKTLHDKISQALSSFRSTKCWDLIVEDVKYIESIRPSGV